MSKIYQELPEEGNNINRSELDPSDTFLNSPTIGDRAEEQQESIPESRVLNPMSAWAGSATIINLVLATGPFSYPYAFVTAGFIPSIVLMAFVMMIAYMTSTFMIEAVSVWCAKRYVGRSDTLFPLIRGEDPQAKITRDLSDINVKESPFYIRQKLEIGLMAEDLIPKFVSYILFFFLVLYMYGAMCLKYVAGAKSLVEGVSVTLYHDADKLKENIGFDPYIIGLAIFAVMSIYFSFGNIENAKVLQIVTTILRFIVTFLMVVGSLISFGTHGGGVAPVKNLFTFDISQFHVLFGNTIFIFIWHHSVSGIVYPVRPQMNIKPMFFWSFFLGSVVLVLEAFLALLAFSHIDNKDCAEFPCEIQKLYNENFLEVPFIGQVSNFYPMLNVAAVPILTITLRNNLFQLFGLESGGESSRLKKGLWSIALSIPVVIITIFLRDPQVLITYTGGFTGMVILLLIPAIFVMQARKIGMEEVHERANFNKSPFSQAFWPYVVFAFSLLTFCVLIYGIIKGGGGGH